jgi:prefoldin subunit 5
MDRPDEVDEAADEMAEDLREMEERSEQVKDEVEEERADWHRKQSDPSVPGAEPDERE